MAAPLAPRGHAFVDRLQPILSVEGERFQLLTAMMGRICVRRLQQPVVTLHGDRDRIIAAIDMLFAGS